MAKKGIIAMQKMPIVMLLIFIIIQIQIFAQKVLAQIHKKKKI